MKHIYTIYFIIFFLLLFSGSTYAGSIYSIGGSGADESSDAVIDIDGSYIITGSFSGTVDFDPGTAVFDMISTGGTDAFVAKYDYEGKFLWAFKLGSNQNDRGNAIAVDYLGDIVVTGSFQGTVDFDPGTGRTNATSRGGKDVFVAKYSSDGSFQWVKTYGSASDDEGIDVHFDFMGYPYVTGYFNLSINLNPITPVDPNTVFTSRGGSDIFVLCLSDSGNYQFGFSAGGTGNDVGNAVKPMGDGGFCLGGSFSQRANFGLSDSFNLVSKGGTDAFAIKYDFFQNVQWGCRFGDVNSDLIRPGTMESDDEDNLYIGGSFSGTIDINPNGSLKLTSLGSSDGFLAKFNNSGTFLWGFAIGGPADDGVNKIALDSNRNVYISGYFTDQADLDPNPSTSYFLYGISKSGNFNGFAARYNQDGKFVWAGSYGNIGNSQFSNSQSNSIATDPSGVSIVSGPFLEKTIFQFQTDKDSLTASGGTDIFALLLGSNGKFLNGSQPSNPKLTLTSPIGGEEWIIGYKYNIKWTSENINSIKISYQTSSSTGWKSISSNVLASLGTLDWIIPNQPSTKCLVRITSVDDNVTSDTSAKYFTIRVAPALSLLSPSGGEVFNSGDNHEITWDYSGSDDFPLIVSYRITDTDSWKKIATVNTVQTKKLTWNVPNEPSKTCKVRIADEATNGKNYSDSTFGYFTIKKGDGIEENIPGVNYSITNLIKDVIRINLQSENQFDYSAEIFYITGAPTGVSGSQTINEASTSIELNVNELTDGFYILRININGKNYFRKIIISR